ncbi:membrane protein AbrB duplication [Thalassoporum mexicanum PCC 7367]|uniref:AbrB family transcriptional regulator n=1 Tax=Thalassoporum mexicanum TaxID=3457544 RepID=UPI00029FB9DF|nr:AbrB family transcriptional regulator [Pseudanabaena sp. PCC 7367]AFY68470.1 membrane protein AbrB duplication [Pseudanabaena sp. PCC 7367]
MSEEAIAITIAEPTTPTQRIGQLSLTLWQNSPQLMAEGLRIAGILAIASLIGFIFSSIGVPVGWLLGPMVAGIGLALLSTDTPKLPALLGITGQAIVGLATAMRFTWETVASASQYAIPLLLCIVVTGALSLGNGYLLWKWTGIDRVTSLLGSFPGASFSFAAMSEEMGADAVAVTMLQYLRVLLVSAILPMIVGTFFAHDAAIAAEIAKSAIVPIHDASILTAAINVLTLAILGLLGVWAGKKLKLPSSLFTGSFLAGLAGLWLLPYDLEMPPLAFTIGLLLVGLSIGLKFHLQTLRKIFKAIVLETFLVVALILICVAIGYGFHQVTHVDTMTALLGSSPGGTTAMLATVVELGGDSGLVMAMQMTRMLMVILLSPWITTSLLSKNEQARDAV